ncbi:MAG: thiamine-phosphate kinase [Flavobacteriales bacterium]|nr:thiamine-phosphate kinase [Flavobacteriales bacterium]
MSLLEDKTPKRTPISELGEFGLIEHLTKSISIQNDSTVKGIGDDCAVIDSGNSFTLVTTDMLVEGVHFDLSYTPLKHLGYKSVVVNLSDIYAMNGDAKHITVSIALSNRFPLEAVEELYEGIHLACKNYNVDLVGGDTTSSTSGLCISITAIGEVSKENVVYRSGAKEHDLIVVSGDLGSAYLGLQILNREKQVFEANPSMQPDLQNKDYILQRQLKPEARKDVIELLKSQAIVPTSMIDISDGLSSELLHLCKNSSSGCAIYEDKLPIDFSAITTAEELNLNAATCALSGGEDYELLFTISQEHYEKIKNDPDLTVIGHITDQSSGTVFVSKNDNHQPLIAQGWNSIS